MPQAWWRVAYITALLTIFSVAAHARFSVSFETFIDGDVRGYLEPALSTLRGQGFVHLQGLNYLYPGALLLVLKSFGDMRGILLSQQTLGLLGGMLLVLSWNRLADFLPSSRVPRSVHYGIGLVGAAMFLLSHPPRFLELYVRSDAVCMFLQLLAIWLLLQFLYYRLVAAGAHRATAVYAILVCSAAYVLASVKPSFTLAAIVIALPVLWLMLRSRAGWGYRVVFVAGSTAIILALEIPEQLLKRTDATTDYFLPATLFAVHANIIHAQMQADLARDETGEYPRDLLQVSADELGAALLDRSPQFFRLRASLGFDPDSLIFPAEGVVQRWRARFGDEEGLIRFLNYHYRRALLGRPFEFAAKIGRQLGVFYRNCPAFNSQKKRGVDRRYCDSAKILDDPTIQALMTPLAWTQKFVTRTKELCASGAAIAQPKRIRQLNWLFARTYLPLLLVAVPAALWIALRRGSSSNEKFGAFFVLLFYSQNFGNTLGISVVHFMEIERYSSVQFVAALLAHLWGIRWLLELALASINRVRSRPEPSFA